MELVRHGLAEHALKQRQRKRTAERRGCRHEISGGRREPVEAREDRLLHGRGHLDLDRMIEPPAVVSADEGADIGERADELLEEERVPAGGLENAALELGRQGRRRDESGEELSVRVAERAEVDLAQQMRELA